MNRKGNVFYEDSLCGIIEEIETGYRFSYDLDYINDSNNVRKMFILLSGE